MTNPAKLKPRRSNAKLDSHAVRMIRASKQSNRALARLTGVSHETIRLCRETSRETLLEQNQARY